MKSSRLQSPANVPVTTLTVFSPGRSHSLGISDVGALAAYEPPIGVSMPFTTSRFAACAVDGVRADVERERRVAEPSVAVASTASPSTVSSVVAPSPPAGRAPVTVTVPLASVPSTGVSRGAPAGALFTRTLCAVASPAAVRASIVCAPLASVVVSRSALRPVVPCGSPCTKNVSSARSSRLVLVPQLPSPNA